MCGGRVDLGHDVLHRRDGRVGAVAQRDVEHRAVLVMLIFSPENIFLASRDMRSAASGASRVIVCGDAVLGEVEKRLQTQARIS